MSVFVRNIGPPRNYSASSFPLDRPTVDDIPALDSESVSNWIEISFRIPLAMLDLLDFAAERNGQGIQAAFSVPPLNSLLT